jgi:putative membrane protein
MKHVLYTGGAFMLSCGLALAQTPSTSATSPVTAPPTITTPGTSSAPSAPNVSAADRRFVQMAAESGISEVQASQLAESKSESSAVKDFAARMISDHSKANQQLMQIAGTRNISIPSGPDTADTVTLQKLQALSGTQFNHWYIRTQVQDHVKAVALFKTEAANGMDPQLKQFAQQTLPILQMHLKMARNLSGHTGAQG